MIDLKCFNKKELADFVISDKYKTYDFLPVTKHRALSQIKNLKADEDDILLTLAFEGEKLAGYLGTFPDLLIIDKKSVKYAWLSTLYVNENFRGKRIAQQLLDKVFEKYEGKIAITEFTKEAESLYAKTKMFNYIEPKIGKRFYFRSDFETIIPRRKPKFSGLKPLFKTIDFVANTLVSTKIQLEKNKKINFEITNSVDQESEDFINKFPKNRTAEELNLIIKNPWVLEGENSEINYLFSSFSKEFRYVWVKIFDEQNNLKTCSLLQIRDRHLKISYLFNKNELGDFVSFLEKFIRENKIKTLVSYHSKLNEKLSSKKLSKLHQKKIERRYLFHKELLKILSENIDLNYQDGDGDAVFT